MATLVAFGFLVVFVVYLVMDHDPKEGGGGCLMLVLIFGVVVGLCLIEVFPRGLNAGFPRIVK